MIIKTKFIVFSPKQIYYSRMKQLNLFKMKTQKSYGGKTLGKRKSTRPLNPKRLHHVIMKSQHAKGLLSFKNPVHRAKIEKLIFDKAQRYGIRIAEFANVGNHFHLLVRFKNIYLIQNFLKVTMGLIARLITGASKTKRYGRFWEGLVFTRIVSKGLDQSRMFDYLAANKIQSDAGTESRCRFEMSKKREWRRRTSKHQKVSSALQLAQLDCRLYRSN